MLSFQSQNEKKKKKLTDQLSSKQLNWVTANQRFSINAEN